jgi:hypothetical protein
VDDFVESMRPGTVAFNVPNAMYVDDDAFVEMLVSQQGSVEDLKQELSEPGQQYGAEIKVARRMRADVVAATSGLQVIGLGDTEQVVGTTGKTEWQWRVHAVDVGQQQLEVSLTAIVEIDGRESNKRIDTYRRTIAVNVTTRHRVKQVLDALRDYWAVLAGLTGAVGWVIGRVSTRRTGSPPTSK